MNKVIALLIIISVTIPAFAETIVLKSGKAVEGKIIEKTDKYIKLDIEGIAITYFNDEIEKVDEAGSMIGSASASQEQTIKGILNDIEAKSKVINTLREEMIVIASLPQGITNSEIELFQKGNKFRVKQYISIGGNQGELLTICNNNIIYTRNPAGRGFLKLDLARLREAGVSETYTNPTTQEAFNPLFGLNKNTLEYIGLEELNGKSMYVIEGKREEIMNKMSSLYNFNIVKEKLWIGKEDGLLHKKISFNTFGKEISLVELKKAEINIPISDDIFSIPTDEPIVDNTELTIQSFKKVLQ